MSDELEKKTEDKEDTVLSRTLVAQVGKDAATRDVQAVVIGDEADKKMDKEVSKDENVNEQDREEEK